MLHRLHRRDTRLHNTFIWLIAGIHRHADIAHNERELSLLQPLD